MPPNRAIRNHLVDAALEFFIRPYATNPMRQQTKTIILIGCLLAAPETLAVSTAMAEVGGSGPAASKPSSGPKSGTPATVVDDKKIDERRRLRSYRYRDCTEPIGTRPLHCIVSLYTLNMSRLFRTHFNSNKAVKSQGQVSDEKYVVAQ